METHRLPLLRDWRFHNPRPATRHDSEAETRNGLADLMRANIVGMSFWKPRTAEHRHTGTAKMQGAEPSNEFHHHATDEFEFTYARVRPA
jgi:hypothetical protein